MPTPPQQARKDLGQRLRELRLDVQPRMTQRELARLAGWHFPKVSKIESGGQMPSEDDIRAWCRATGAEQHVDDLIATARNIDAQYREWRQVMRSGARLRQETFGDQESRTTLFRVFEPIFIPGLFQTEDYARTRIAENIAFDGVPDDTDAAVDARMRRQDILRRGDRDRRFHVLLSETALLIGIADDDVLLAQLDRLLTLSILPRLALGIIPLRARHRRAPRHGFWMLDDRLVLVETVAAELTVTQPAEIAVYAREFALLAESAVYGQAARELIAQAIRTIRET
jgi:transcriptional regulator with XRE-family HTH domain